MARYYHPSGKFAPSFILYFLVTILLACPMLGLIYAYAIWYIPFIYINFILAGGLGFVVALIVSFLVVKKGKVRNIPLAYALGALGGVAALYFQWVVWIDLVLNMGETVVGSRIGVTVSTIKILDVFALAFQPSLMIELMVEINQYGTWGIGGSGAAVSGGILSVIWVIEAVLIVGASAHFSGPSARDPFCEVGNTWFDEIVLEPMEYVRNRGRLVERIGNGDNDAFSEVYHVSNVISDMSLFQLYTSEFDEHYLSITNRKASPNGKGEIEYDDLEVVTHIGISTLQKQRLLATGPRPIENEENASNES